MFKIDYTFLITISGFILLAIASGLLSSLLVIKKETLINDVVSHSTLPGIIICFIFLKNNSYFILSLGAFISGVLALILIKKIKKNVNLDLNSLLVIILSIFMGFGFVLLSVIRRNPSTQQAGIESYLLGQAVSINIYDVFFLFVIDLILILIIILFFKELKMFIFDSLYMQSTNYDINIINNLFVLMIILAIISQIQMIGIIFTASMLTIPGLFAIQWAKSFTQTIVYAILISIISVLISAFLSASFEKVSMGASCVFILSLITLISLVIKNKKGAK